MDKKQKNTHESNATNKVDRMMHIKKEIKQKHFNPQAILTRIHLSIKKRAMKNCELGK